MIRVIFEYLKHWITCKEWLDKGWDGMWSAFAYISCNTVGTLFHVFILARLYHTSHRIALGCVFLWSSILAFFGSHGWCTAVCLTSHWPKVHFQTISLHAQMCLLIHRGLGRDLTTWGIECSTSNVWVTDICVAPHQYEFCKSGLGRYLYSTDVLITIE